ncbi:MFS general substrate transporter [Phellopilus nigrolimitatus]|nr:MFS general substrate transporter [Phellopilus nigrolimitatus]
MHPASMRSTRSLLSHSSLEVEPRSGSRVYLVRALALLCACSLSIGSHYASYILGPLKTRLSREMGTSNTEFSLLIAAFSLNSTWTPLLGGFLAGHLGTTITSIIATGLILLGQAVLLLGDIMESVRLMTLGMFIFGLGVSPLAVVQESIIVRFFKDHGLGLSMALGLVVGKASSFVAARTSYPLSENYGNRAPFVAATSLAAFSFTMNLVYLSASKWLVNSSGTELESSELRREARNIRVESLSEAQALKQVAKKRSVHTRDITKLGDVFWAVLSYIGINVLCGAIWSPFTHLASNIFEKRYDLSEHDASSEASFLLAGSVFLYPICGYLIDHMKHRSILHQLFLLSSVLTTLCYFWLVLPPKITGTPVPAVALYGIGQGFAPLLLVIIVPTLVSSKYVPTTLGAHKSLEQTGSTIFQTFAGLFLDRVKTENAQATATSETSSSQLGAIQRLLGLFLFLNICQFFAIVGLWALDRRRKRQASAVARSLRLDTTDEEDEIVFDAESDRQPKPSRRNPSLAKENSSRSLSLQHRETSSPNGSPVMPLAGGSRVVDVPEGEEQPLLTEEPQAWQAQAEASVSGEAQTKGELLRGEIFGVISVCLIAFAWLFFIGTAFLKLRAKKDRG